MFTLRHLCIISLSEVPSPRKLASILYRCRGDRPVVPYG